jgi:tetratricopeptide (TPR) repeat protein
LANSIFNRVRRLLGKDRDSAGEILDTAFVAPASSTQQSPPPTTSQAPHKPSVATAADFLLADKLRDAGQLDEALAKLSQMRFASPKDPDVLRRLGVVYYMAGQIEPAADALAQVVQARPQDPMALKFLAGCLSALGRTQDALEIARRSIAITPRDAQMRNVLGAMCVKAGLFEEAIVHFRSALELNPRDLTPLANLEVLQARFGGAGLQKDVPAFIVALRRGVIADLTSKLGRHALTIEEADLLCTLTNNHRESFQIAEEISVQFEARDDLPSGLLINLAVVAQNRGDIAKTLSYYQRAVAIDHGSDEISHGLGAAYISEGDDRWLEGWRLVSQCYRRLNPRNYPVAVPQWLGQPISGGRLLVHMDQGVGDALLGLRFLARVLDAGIDVVLWLPVRLKDLTGGLDTRIEVIVSEDLPDPNQHGCVFACGLLELIAPLGLSREQIGDAPVLSVPEHIKTKWRDRFASLSGRKIALCTLGNPGRIDDWLRSVDPDTLSSLGALKGVSWINLAVDDRPERRQLVDRLAMLDVSRELTDFGETAGALSAVDLLISIDCSTAHVAGSIGTPFWLLQPTMLDWRWQIGFEKSPWWPKARVYQASAPGSFSGAISSLSADLQNFIGQAKRSV